MARLLSRELKRALTSPGMIISVVVGLAISIAYTWMVQLQMVEMNRQWVNGELLYELMCPKSAEVYNMLQDITNAQPFIFYMLLPVLAVLPFGASLSQDKKSGYLVQLRQRCSSASCMRAKYFATFLSGGIAVIIPLIVSILCAYMLLPSILPDATMPMNSLNASVFLNAWFYRFPAVYFATYGLITFAVAGCYACVGLLMSTFLNNYFVICSFGFFVQLFINTVLSMEVESDWWSTVYWTRSGIGIRNGMVVLVWAICLGIIPAVLYFIRSRKMDV